MPRDCSTSSANADGMLVQPKTVPTLYNQSHAFASKPHI